MTRVSLLCLLVPVAALGCDATGTDPTSVANEAPSFSINGEREEQTSYFTTTAFIPCALNGAGEFVDITGTWTWRRWLLRNPAGGSTIVLQEFIKDATGFGRTSGDSYRLTGPSSLSGSSIETGHANAGGTFTNTEASFYFLIGQGSGTVLLRRGAHHESTNPNLDGPIEFHLEFVKCL